MTVAEVKLLPPLDMWQKQIPQMQGQIDEFVAFQSAQSKHLAQLQLRIGKIERQLEELAKTIV